MTRKEAVIGSTLVMVSPVLALLAAEVAFRWVDGFAVTPLRLKAVPRSDPGHVVGEPADPRSLRRRST